MLSKPLVSPNFGHDTMNSMILSIVFNQLLRKEVSELIILRQSVIITTNLEIFGMKKCFGDEKMTAVLLDRLTYLSHIHLLMRLYLIRQSIF